MSSPEPNQCHHNEPTSYRLGREDNRGFRHASCPVCGKFVGWKPPDDWRKPVKQTGEDTDETNLMSQARQKRIDDEVS